MKKRNRVREVLYALSLRMLDEEDSPSTKEIVARARELHPDVFVAEAEHLIFERAMREVDSIMRDLSDDDIETDGQMVLPGINFPSAINVGGTRWVQTRKANLHQLEAGLVAREANLERAQAKRDTYRRSLETVRPYMVDKPDTYTLADALREIGEDGEEEAS